MWSCQVHMCYGATDSTWSQHWTSFKHIIKVQTVKLKGCINLSWGNAFNTNKWHGLFQSDNNIIYQLNLPVHHVHILVKITRAEIISLDNDTLDKISGYKQYISDIGINLMIIRTWLISVILDLKFFFVKLATE